MVDEEEPTFRVEGDPEGAQGLRLGGRPSVAHEPGREPAGSAADDDRDPAGLDAVHAGGPAVGGVETTLGVRRRSCVGLNPTGYPGGDVSDCAAAGIAGQRERRGQTP